MKDVDNFPFAVLGNKCDLELERQVTTEEALNMVEQWKGIFCETSAKFGINIEEVFVDLAREILKYGPNWRRMKWAAKIWEASAFLASENGFSGSTEALSGLLGEDKESLEKRFGEEFRELYTKPYNVPTGERSKSLKANYPDSFKAYIKLRFENANSA